MPACSNPSPLNELRALQRNQRGAAMLEFLVVLTPLLLIFLCTIELSRLAIAELMLQRAAGIAVRACAVMKDQPLHCDANADSSGQNVGEDGQITLAAEEALKPLPTTTLGISGNAECTTDENNADGRPTDIGGHLVTGKVAQSGWDTITVRARFHCMVPLASAIICPDVEKISPFGAGVERTRLLSAAARYGHQGARYDCWFAKSVEFPIGGPHAGPEFESDTGDVDPWDF